MLRGETMHKAGKMTREQSLKARHLKPTAQARKALEAGWRDPALLAADEISMTNPPLLAGIHRRAFYGRRRFLP